MTFDSFARAHQPAFQARISVITERTITITPVGTLQMIMQRKLCGKAPLRILSSYT